MSRKQFSWLLLVTFLIVVLALVFPGKTGRESGMDQTALIPGLARQVNDIQWLRLTRAGDEPVATLKRQSDAWVVEEASGYRADWDQLKTFLASLAQAEVIEEKTSKPGYYARLGVEDVSSADSPGILVEFAENSGLPAVILGKSAQGREGQYVRLANSAQSVLIDTLIDVPGDRIAWLDKTIVDISDAEIVEYEITHPDGESIKAVKTSADDENFELQDLPEGREIRSEQGVDAPANSLAALDLQAVVPATQLSWENTTRFRILTADGLMVDAELLVVQSSEEGGAQPEHWLRLNAGVYTTAIGPEIDSEAESSATLARAEELNARVAGWAYRIPAFSFDSMSRRTEYMLQPVEDESEPPSL